MKHITLEQKLRASSVKRWHIVQTTIVQTLADHSYRVAMLTEALLKLFCEVYFNNGTHKYTVLRARSIDVALHHDVLEVLTGDMPTTYKDWLRDAGYGPPEPTFLMEKENCYPGDSDNEVLIAMLVKLADLIEAATFIRDYGVGAHAEVVSRNLNLRLADVDGWMPRFHPQVSDYSISGMDRSWTVEDIYSDSGERRVKWDNFLSHFMNNYVNAKPEEISDGER